MARRANSGVRALGLTLLCPLLLLLADAVFARPAHAQAQAQAQAHDALLGQRLQRALDEQGADARVAIRVSLRADDLPRTASRRPQVEARQQRVLDAIPAGDFELGRRYQSISGFSGRAGRHAIAAMRRNPEVVSIHLDGAVHASLAQARLLIGATTVHTLGFTGAGINVAVLDTGIDTDHPGLADDLVAEECFCDNHPSPNRGCCPGGRGTQSGPGAAEDDAGHGTNVSGIITSIFGIAPDAGIVAIKVLSSTGSGRDSDIDAALDWVLLNHAAQSIRVVNMSLGDGGQYNDPNVSSCFGNPTANAIRDLALAGVATFVASGNEGHDNGIASPACSAEAISVAGTYDANLGSVSWCGNASCSTILCTDNATTDSFVCHSNSDELLDLVAPDWQTTTSDIGGGSTSFGGTSAASPFAAAQAALLLEADPALTPAAIRTRMQSFGPLVTNPANGLAFRRTDIGAAVGELTAVCGNTIVEFGEACDDGNLADGDCCSSSCQAEGAGGSCDDGLLCTEGDACDGAGACAGAPVVCDDANFCTDDFCDSGMGCTFTPNITPCDDADACTGGDTCSAGVCVGSPVVCDDANFCTDDGCEPGTGCTVTPNAIPCDDGTACTTGDACNAGACTGAPLACDDANACTDDTCDPGTGCTFTPSNDPCNDGTACTSSDTCSAGLCAGTAIDCDDGDRCTAEACDSVLGCTHAPVLGCGLLVPAMTPWGRLAVAAFALVGGVLGLRWSRARTLLRARR